MKSGTVKGGEIRKNRDGDADVIVLQVEITAPEDIQSVELITHGGVDMWPVSESVAMIEKVGNAWKLVTTTTDGITPEANPGEYEIYSSSGGSKLVRVKCKDDGKLNISNVAESLDTLFDDFFDALIAIVTIGSPTTHTLDGATQTALTTLKARFQSLLGAL